MNAGPTLRQQSVTLSWELFLGSANAHLLFGYTYELRVYIWDILFFLLKQLYLHTACGMQTFVFLHATVSYVRCVLPGFGDDAPLPTCRPCWPRAAYARVWLEAAFRRRNRS